MRSLRSLPPVLTLLTILALPTLLAACSGSPRTPGGPETAMPPGAAGSDRTETAVPAPRTGRLVPEALKGLTAAQAEGALGPPSFRHRDPPAEIWQYRVHACTLDLFLYDEGGSRVVAHFAVRSPNGAGIGDRACLDEVLAHRVEPPTS